MKKALQFISRLRLVAIIVAVIAAAVAVLYVANGLRKGHVGIGSDMRIGDTPERVVSIKAIGQWEFLSVSDEELVDTVRRGIFTDDHLSRIYYGTMRLGIDLAEARQGWIVARGDSVGVVLPPIKLLDDDFIDEARTRPFAESGRWSAADREAMYQRARQSMLQRGLSPANIRSAENNADAQFRHMLRAMGFDNITIRFDKN